MAKEGAAWRVTGGLDVGVALRAGRAARALRMLLRHRSAILGLVLFGGVLLIAVAAPWIAPYDPNAQDLRKALLPPGSGHPFGTDPYGRDVFSRVIHGSRISMQVGLISVTIAGVTGVTLGIVAGFRGGWIDTAVSHLVDFMLAFPGILLALAIVATLGPGLYNVMVAVGIAGVPAYVRVARGITLSVRGVEYVEAARALGARTRRVLTRHVLPGVLPPVIVMATLDMASAILTASALSFLGLGAQPPLAEWGAMVAQGRDYIREAWWVATFPGLAIMASVLGINMLGDAAREVWDPRLRPR